MKKIKLNIVRLFTSVDVCVYARTHTVLILHLPSTLQLIYLTQAWNFLSKLASKIVTAPWSLDPPKFS